MTQPCPYCSGTAVIRLVATICCEILDEVRKAAGEVDGPAMQLRVHPDIARALREDESAVLREMQTAVGKKVSIRADPHLHHEQFDVMVLQGPSGLSPRPIRIRDALAAMEPIMSGIIPCHASG